MKKVLALTLAIMMMLAALVGCGGAKDDNTLVCGVTIFYNMNEKD